jgi:protein BUR2
MMPARRIPSPARDSFKEPEDVLAESEQQWLYTESEVLRSPSIVDGMDPKEEHILRAKGANFILQVGAMVKIPQTTVSTACVLFNRFLMRYSLVPKPGHKPLHHYQIAGVVLFVTTKVEEHARKIKELVIACCRVAQKNPVLVVDEQTKDFWRWRDTILYHEDYVLELLCFDLTIESPYNLLYAFLKNYGVASNKLLRDTSWAFINDTSMTYMCLLFSSRTIAVAAIYCAAKLAGVSFPDDSKGRSWWESQRVKGEDMRAAYNYMVNLFETGILKTERPYVGSQTPLQGDPDEKTRLRREQAPATPEPVDVGAWVENIENQPKPPPRSRIPAAAALESRPAKRFKMDDQEEGEVSRESNGNDNNDVGSGSEEGEVEE